MKGASAEEVRDRREKAGLTQWEAADLVGITIGAWQHYEYGVRRIPEPTWRLFKLLTGDER